MDGLRVELQSFLLTCFRYRNVHIRLLFGKHPGYVDVWFEAILLIYALLVMLTCHG